MEQKLNLENFIPVDCFASKNSTEEVFEVECAENGGYLLINDVQKETGYVDWSKVKYIVFDAKNMEKWIMGIRIYFWNTSNTGQVPDLEIRIGLIPDILTRISIPIEALNSQKVYLVRTPGKLKTMIEGNKVDIREVNRIAIGTTECSKRQKFEISALHLAEEEPEYPLPDVKLVDEFGQWEQKDWAGKTHNIEELHTYLNLELKNAQQNISFSEWSIYGGWKNKRFDATGYFRTQRDGDRWWMVDPEGYAFFSTGLDSVVPGETGRIDGIEKFFTWLPDKDKEYKEAWNMGEKFDDAEYYNFAVSNLINAFGEQWRERWAEITRSRMVNWGFNTIGNWSSPEFIKISNIPYVCQLDNFPETKNKVFRDFPDVFSFEYKENAEKFALQLNNFEGDKYLIGYFLRNEPIWAFIKELNIAEELLENKSDLVSKDVLIEFLLTKYERRIDKLNNVWNTDFSSFEQLKEGIRKAASFSEIAEKDLKEFSLIMIEEYVKIPSQAAKRVDPYHMNLGMRYGFIGSDDLFAGCNNFDVFSFNCYKLNAAEEIENISKKTSLPVMIGEFHFGALDRGLLATGLRAVTSQQERGKAYRYYLENAAAIDSCVGAHYFILNDQAVLGRFDGENFQIGCVDVCHRPYEEFIKEVTDTNRKIYEVVDRKRVKYSVIPEELKIVAG